jgi:glucose/arabinose dehydrogenase
LPLIFALAVGLLLLAGLMATAQAGAPAAPLSPNAVSAVLYATGLSQPVDIAHTGMPTDTRLFVVERAGRIMVVQSSGATGTLLGTPFLDITHTVDSHSHGEMGLLGLAFSPNYATDGQFFVYYNHDLSSIRLERYTVNPTDPNVANATGTVILTLPNSSTAGNHNGGDLAFGPDGFLYLAPGDGGDTPQNAQDTNSLLGKVLRLDVTGAPPYTIPITNPFASSAGRDEIWALGLRNPFRFSFDRQTGDLYVADVGQNAWEEVNFQPAASPGGENYGWSCYEGNHNFNPSNCGDPSDYVFPVAEYCHTGGSCTNGGQAVIGGYVYRGANHPGLFGYYFFADSYSNRFWAMRAGGPWGMALLNITNVPNPSSFGEDYNGELYVAALGNGSLYRLQGAVVHPLQTPHYLPLIRR